MATRQYIGARYVPKFYQNSVDGSASWESNVVYEPLTYVTLTNGHMYISKKQVPATIGTPASNADYWLDVGNYNGFIEELQNQIDAINNTTIPAIEDKIDNICSVKMFGAIGDGVTDDTQAFINALNAYDVIIVPNGNYKLSSSLSSIQRKTILGFNAKFILSHEIIFTDCTISGIYFDLTRNISATGKTKFELCTFDATNFTTTQSGMLIAIANGNGDYTFNKCVFNGHSKPNFGIWADDSTNSGGSLYVTECKFTEMWLNAIFASITKIVIEGCTFWHNHQQSTPTGGGEIDLTKTAGESPMARIVNNVFLAPNGNNTCHVETEGEVFLVIENNYFNSWGVAAASVVLQQLAKGNLIGNYFVGDAGMTAVATFNGSTLVALGNYFVGFGTKYSDNTAVISAQDLN